MKVFLLKISLILIGLWIIFIAADSILPPFWGNEIIDDKLEYLKTLDDIKFDTYFIGSSRVNNQINPNIFDRITDHQSFNLGCPSLSGIETLNLADHLLSNAKLSKPLKNIIIGMPLIAFRKTLNSETLRGSYYFDFKAFKECYKVSRDDNMAFTTLFKQSSYQISTFLKNTIKLGQLNAMISYWTRPVPRKKYLSFKKLKGYIPLNTNSVKPSDVKRRNLFLQDTTILTQRLKEAKQYIARNNGLDNLNEYYNSKLTNLIYKAKQQGVTITFIQFPKANGAIYKKTMNVFKRLNRKNKINLAHPKKYLQFYYSDLSYDRAHLNKKGSELFTKILAEEHKKNKTFE